MDTMSDADYGKHLFRKRVALVSHGANLVGSRQGSLIDSYDTVIRINDSIPIPRELKPDVGTRCDILYSSLSPNFAVSCGQVQPFIDSGVKVVVRPCPLQWPKMKGIVGGCNVAYWRDKFVERVLDTNISLRVADKQPYLFHVLEMGGNIPFTGVAAILDLLNFPVSEIFLVGFNFFLEGTYDQYPQQPRTPEELEKWNWGTKWTEGHRHSILPQIQYLYKMVQKYDVITMDSVLTAILEKHGPKNDNIPQS